MKTVDRATKQMKGWDSQSYVLHMYVTFHVSFFEFSLGSVGALCRISDIKIFEKVIPPIVFIEFQPNVMESMLVRGKYRLLLFLDPPAKLKKKKRQFEIFVNTGQY